MTMNSLTDLYTQALVPMDQELEKQAAELYKQAEEEDACGRIMARGFADELNKLAGAPFKRTPAPPPTIEKTKAMKPNEAFGPGKTITPGGNVEMKPDKLAPKKTKAPAPPQA